MTQLKKTETRVFPDAAAMTRASADAVAAAAVRCVDARGTFRIALSGGASPKALFFLLAGEGYRSLPWDRFEVFWGDDRYVPWTHSESNFRGANDLLLTRVPVPRKNIHPMPTDSKSPFADALRYETELRSLFAVPGEGFPALDFALMGVGGDGHTASLFPGGPELRESRRWVVSSRSPIGVKDRITMTVPVFNSCREALFLVEGEGKAEVLREILQGSSPAERFPAKLIQPADGRLVYMLDQAAASRLIGHPS